MVHNKQNGKLNGINNRAFVADETASPQLGAEDEKAPKKKAAPQPPTQANGIVDNEIPAEITRLDEILEAAEIGDSVIERKLSVDTVSNVSDFVPHEESVVAVVHRDNVVTPANSKAPSFSSHRNESFSDINDPSSIDPDVKVESGSNMTSEIGAQNEIQTEAPAPDYDIETKEALPDVDYDMPTKEEASQEDNDAESIKNDTTGRSSTASVIPTPPPSPNSPIFKMKEDRVDRAPTPPRYVAPMLSVEELKEIVRPTSSNLRSVTLRPTKQREEIKNNEVYEPGEENLKFGSDKYKHFLQNLSGKLQNMTVVPTHIPLTNNKKAPDSRPVSKLEEDRRPNENVLEDSINKIDAMEKLGSFISDPSRNKGILGNINLLNQVPTNEEQMEQGVVKNDDEENNRSPDDDDDKVSNTTSNSDFMEHKDRMQNVFRSMNLKKSDSFKEPESVESRTVKSLGPSFLADDKSKHRQAMGEIFKSIEKRRSQDDGE